MDDAWIAGDDRMGYLLQSVSLDPVGLCAAYRAAVDHARECHEDDELEGVSGHT